MANQKKIDVIIDGMKYTLFADANQDKTVKIASYVDSKIQEMKSGNTRLNPAMLYVISLMNITGELFDMKEKYDSLVEESKEPIQRFKTISEEVEKMTKERESQDKAVEQLKDDLVISLNTISDMNKRYTGLDEENKANLETIAFKNKQLFELNDNMTQMQKELVSLEKKYQDLVKKLEKIDRK